MKKIIIALFLIVLCGACSRTPILNNKSNPFIVTKITIVNSEFAMYYSTQTMGSGSLLSRNTIVLPVKWFNIGDTIKFKR